MCADNVGGYKPYVLFIPACQVVDVPKIKSSIINEATSSVETFGTFTFKDTKNVPIYIQCTDKTVKCDAENQGDIEGQSFKITGSFFSSGRKKRNIAVARQINNTPGYLILEELDGKQIMIGQPGLPCLIKPNFNGGMGRSDKKGIEFIFQADSIASKNLSSINNLL